ncbi:Opacity protein [Parelusimicrobium proximum]|uniref:hypothetical protein n=1 Tax=Parelusimicrobium proximum TaxID=3228953 RepID=UPI003D18144C
MKKTVVMLSAFLLMATAAFAEIGIGVKYGTGSDDNNFEDEFVVGNNYSSSEDSGVIGAEFLYQQRGMFNMSQDHMLGIKAGYEYNGEVRYMDYTPPAGILSVKVEKIPVTLFYRYAPESSKFNVWAGAGLTVAMARWEYWVLSDKDEEVKVKVFPHIKAGAEWRPVKFFGLGLDAGYNIGAKFKVPDGDVNRDISGFECMAAARFYFF